MPPGLDVTMYAVTGLPPSSSGGLNETVACRLPGAALGSNGGLSAVEFTQITAFEGADSGPLPALVVACTVKVYVVPFVNPVTAIGLVVPVAVMPPGLDVTVYPVMGAPPVVIGGVNETLTPPGPTAALIPVGAPGRPSGWAKPASASGPSPSAFVAY